MLTSTAPKVSVNNTGDIAFYEGVEYRWRDGATYQRLENGNLKSVDWHSVPLAVRDALTECQS